jgi:hypothetical protein
MIKKIINKIKKMMGEPLSTALKVMIYLGIFCVVYFAGLWLVKMAVC